jgi:hypothetical protein
MKQTAVKWLVEQLECFGNKHELQLSWATVDELVEQAKAMEKEEQRLIYEGLLQNVGTSVKQSDLPTFEQYYNETYG